MILLENFQTHLQHLATGDHDNTDYAASTRPCSYTSDALVGRTIMHKFEVEKGRQVVYRIYRQLQSEYTSA